MMVVVFWLQVFFFCCDLIIQPNLLVYVCIGCSASPLNFAQEQNCESPKHEVRELRRHGQSSFTRLAATRRSMGEVGPADLAARREPWSWPLQGSSVRMLYGFRHRNRGPWSASFQRPVDNEIRVVVLVGLPDGGVLDSVDRFMEVFAGYVELSDRAIRFGAPAYGLESKEQGCRDDTEFSFGVPALDENSNRPMLKTLAKLNNRSCVVTSITSNPLLTEWSCRSLSQSPQRRQRLCSLRGWVLCPTISGVA